MKNLPIKYVYLFAGLLFTSGIAYFLISQPASPSGFDSRLFQPETEKLAGIVNKIGSFGFAGAPETKDDSLALALNLYEKSDYAEARTLLESLLKTYPNEQVATFYLGLSHLYSQAPETALELLSPLTEQIDFFMRDDATWYAALAASNTDKKQATALFNRLSHDPASKYQDAAGAVISAGSKSDTEFRFNVGAKSTFLVAPNPAWWQMEWMRIAVVVLTVLACLSLVHFHRHERQKIVSA